MDQQPSIKSQAKSWWDQVNDFADRRPALAVLATLATIFLACFGLSYVVAIPAIHNWFTSLGTVLNGLLRAVPVIGVIVVSFDEARRGLVLKGFAILAGGLVAVAALYWLSANL